MKRIMFLITALIFLMASIPVMAADNPIIYSETITVTEDGGRYQIGFINVEFKKDFLDPEMLPATFDVKVYAEDGIGYIEFNPDTPNFFKKVHIRVDKYDGMIYDQATGENIQVNVKNHQILAEHFSRYAWIR